MVRQALVTRGKRFARAAGAVYLSFVVVTAIVQVSAHAGINVPGTAIAGAQDSGTGSTLPAVTHDADVSMAVSLLLVGVTLYLLFRHVDRRIAAAPVVYLAVGVGLLVVNLLFHHAALLVPSASSTGGLGAQSVNRLVSMLLDLSDRGYTVAGAALGSVPASLGSLAPSWTTRRTARSSWWRIPSVGVPGRALRRASSPAGRRGGVRRCARSLGRPSP